MTKKHLVIRILKQIIFLVYILTLKIITIITISKHIIKKTFQYHNDNHLLCIYSSTLSSRHTLLIHTRVLRCLCLDTNSVCLNRLTTVTAAVGPCKTKKKIILKQNSSSVKTFYFNRFFFVNLNYIKYTIEEYNILFLFY